MSVKKQLLASSCWLLAVSLETISNAWLTKTRVAPPLTGKRGGRDQGTTKPMPSGIG